MEFVGALVVVGLVFGVISAIIASSRNRNAFGWFLAGGLFGFLGLILLLALPPIENPSYQRRTAPPPPLRSGSTADVHPRGRQVAKDPEKKCPFCAEWVKEEAIKCRFCGSDIGQPAPPPSQDDQISSNDPDGGPMDAGVVVEGDADALSIALVDIPESDVMPAIRREMGALEHIGHLRVDLQFRDITRGTAASVIEHIVGLLSDKRVDGVTLAGVSGALRPYARLELKRAALELHQDGTDFVIRPT